VQCGWLMQGAAAIAVLRRFVAAIVTGLPGSIVILGHAGHAVMAVVPDIARRPVHDASGSRSRGIQRQDQDQQQSQHFSHADSHVARVRLRVFYRKFQPPARPGA
jgi:hypothetical protein